MKERVKDSGPIRPTFTFYNVPEGTYHVRFYSPVYENVRDSADQIVVSQSNDDLKITLSVPTYSVSGMAYQFDGTPYSNESIHLQDSYGASWSTDITTAEDGSFVIHGLPDGTYKLGDDYDPLASGEVTVEGGDVTGVMVR